MAVRACTGCVKCSTWQGGAQCWENIGKEEKWKHEPGKQMCTFCAAVRDEHKKKASAGSSCASAGSSEERASENGEELQEVIRSIKRLEAFAQMQSGQVEGLFRQVKELQQLLHRERCRSD